MTALNDFPITRKWPAQHPERRWIMGEAHTIADIAIFPRLNNLVSYYEAGELVGYQAVTHVARATQPFLARPAVARGLKIPA